MLVREVMTSPAVTVRPQATLKQVARLLDEHSITALPVVDDAGRLVGVVSEADVLLESLPPDPRAHERPTGEHPGPYLTRVSDVMSAHPVTVSTYTDVSEAAELMTSTTVKSLPVVDDGVVVGVLSRRDLIAVLARSDEAISAELDELFRNLGEDWLVEVEDGVVRVEGPTTERQRDLARTLAGTVRGAVGIRFVGGRG